MVFEIRTAGPDDAAGIAQVWAAAMPQLVKTARGIEAELRAGTRRVALIAVDACDVVGYGNVYLPDEGDPAPRVRITEWNHPDLRRDLSAAVLDGDTVLSFVTTTADPDRRVSWSNLTGTVPAARGRGLAKVVKSAALNRARDAGFLTALTGNDAANAPMLAVNQWLGYQVSSAAWTAEKDL